MDIFGKRAPLDYRDWGQIVREIHDQGVPLSIIAYHLDLSVPYVSTIKEGKRPGAQLKYPQAMRLLEIHEELYG